MSDFFFGRRIPIPRRENYFSESSGVLTYRNSHYETAKNWFSLPFACFPRGWFRGLGKEQTQKAAAGQGDEWRNNLCTYSMIWYKSKQNNATMFNCSGPNKTSDVHMLLLHSLCPSSWVKFCNRFFRPLSDAELSWNVAYSCIFNDKTWINHKIYKYINNNNNFRGSNLVHPLPDVQLS